MLRVGYTTMTKADSSDTADMVNHPPHYKRGPSIALGKCDPYGRIADDAWQRCTFELAGRKWLDVECIDVIRHITDFRLATAIKYIWRVAFGGKDDDRQDIQKAIWYLNDWLENPRR